MTLEVDYYIRDTKDLVQKAIASLDENLRGVVVLRLIDGYSTKEAADILNIPMGTVLSRLSRGRDKLKIALTKLQVIQTNTL